MPRARLLFLVILAYATVLNFFVFKLYLHNHPAVLEKSLDGLQKIKQRRLEGLNRHKTMPVKPPHPDIEPNCAATQSVIAIVNTKSHPIPGRKNQIWRILYSCLVDCQLFDIICPASFLPRQNQHRPAAHISKTMNFFLWEGHGSAPQAAKPGSVVPCTTPPRGVSRKNKAGNP